MHRHAVLYCREPVGGQGRATRSRHQDGGNRWPKEAGPSARRCQPRHGYKLQSVCIAFGHKIALKQERPPCLLFPVLAALLAAGLSDLRLAAGQS